MLPCEHDALGISRFIDARYAAAPGIEQTVMSSCGVVLWAATGSDRAGAEHLAAVSSGLMSLAAAIPPAYGGGRIGTVLITMEKRLVCMAPVDDLTLLTVMAETSHHADRLVRETAAAARAISALLGVTSHHGCGDTLMQPY
ncbi:roadblock/LC7 domain-containing protein [Streptomyces sp. NPDC092307]|uniref:roadblock/LC7 domain-containing protein n=1 Tax=Streptomyces sp. NPDC092307 TaxID=3366013 RepID=UPI0038034600